MNKKYTSPLRFEHEETPDADIIIFICPTQGCGHFYASPEFREDKIDLYRIQIKRGQKGNEPSHAMIDCPQCRTQGRGIVKRIPYVVTGVYPLHKAMKLLKDTDAPEGKDNQAVQIRGESSSTESRRQMQETPRTQLSSRDHLRRSSLLRRVTSEIRNGVRLRRHQSGVEGDRKQP